MTRTKPRHIVIKKLVKAFPNIDGIKSADDWGQKGAIHLGDCAEGGTIDGLPACDYYAWEHDPKEKTYILGVHKKLRELVESNGWFVECYDPGTYLAYKA